MHRDVIGEGLSYDWGVPVDLQKSLNDATEAMHRGSLAEAEDECRTVLAIFPRHYRALFLLGEIHSRAGRAAEARSAYDCAEMSKPGATFRFTQLAIERFRTAFGPAAPARPEVAQNRRRIQMLSLGQNGRFGNQLLQYAFVRLYARQHDLAAEFPDWIGRDIFDFDDPFPSAKLPFLNETDVDLFGSLQGRTGEVFADRDINGYFAGNTKRWGASRSQFCALYTPGQKVAGLLAHALDKLRSRGKAVVAIHLRHGDFGYGRFWVAPSGWYLAWLKTIWATLERPVLYIASDLGGPHAEFADFTPCTADQLGVHIPGGEFLIDHHVLRNADHLAISNSSFSFTAAMLNPLARSFLRPEPNFRGLVAFDPWASDVLLDAIVEPRAVGDHERLMIQNRIVPIDTVVYWGKYCSEWTNFARSVHSRLRIFETEAEARVSDTLRRRNIRHVRLLVLENMDIGSAFIKNAEAVFDQARVDMVLLRSASVPRVNIVLREFSAMGYRVFRLWKDELVPVSSRESNVGGSYLAVRQDLAAAFPYRGLAFYLCGRYLLNKTLLKNLACEPISGAIDYWRHPEMRNTWGGPFNGQQARMALFWSLIAKAKPSAIIETGTFRGTTTEFMAQAGVPIFTVEIQPRNYGFSRARFLRHRRVTVRRGDSRQFLRELFRGSLRNFVDQTVFAYLDAHRNGDLPLSEELDLIFSHCPGAIVMIDDFQVPFDNAYRYDNYGAGEALIPAYIEPNIAAHDLQAFYPSVPASEETGARRGCVVLANKTLNASALASIPELRKSE